MADEEQGHIAGEPKRDRLPARTRLEQAHDHWHRALETYPFVERFFLNTNALIPALRSVTFVLQKNLRHREGFEDWYASWQQRMKADPVMRWVVEARNHIEKIGDLELRSTARVSIVASWLEAPFQESDVPPLASPREIAEAISEGDIPDRVRNEGVLRVERRWVAPDLPDREILDACAYAWGFLDGVLTDAEAVFLGAELDPDRLEVRQRDCMTAGAEARAAQLHLASGEFIQHESIRHRPSETDLAAAEERYGEEIRAIRRPDDTLRDQVRWHHDLARLLLTRDGYHRTMAFIRRHARTIRTTSISPEDQQEKYLLMDKLARVVDSTGADEFIFTSEVWRAPQVAPDDPRFELRAGDREDRGEGLSTIGANRRGEVVDFESDFTRDGDRIVLADAQEVVAVLNLSLAPVLKVWGINPLPPGATIHAATNPTGHHHQSGHIDDR